MTPDSPKTDGLALGPLTRHAAHLCVDVQNIFCEPTPWHVPWLARILPAIERISLLHPERNIFTRFIPPRQAEDLPGTWQRYYRHWPQMLRERVDPHLLQLVPSLAAIAAVGTVLDKPVYSPFANPLLLRHLRERQIDSLIVTGVETDVCVLSAVLSAVDEGFRVVLVKDALGSSSDATHDALLELYATRLSMQIELADAATIAALWL
ncbi:MAG TPA: isochorismatase family cysteine hydrolase [Stellaceae bacterium]|nr:isochorismatase family cysteine hydrolase [Stellaceae bacterium]